MASSTFNVECLTATKRAIECLQELGPNMKRGIDNCCEICKESGSPELIKSAEGVAEGETALLKTLDEVVETITKLADYYDRVARAMGLA